MKFMTPLLMLRTMLFDVDVDVYVLFVHLIAYVVALAVFGTFSRSVGLVFIGR